MKNPQNVAVIYAILVEIHTNMPPLCANTRKNARAPDKTYQRPPYQNQRK
jgi:hypothetical protein